MNKEIKFFDSLLNERPKHSLDSVLKVIEQVNTLKDSWDNFGNFISELLYSADLYREICNHEVAYIIEDLYIPFMLKIVTPSKSYQEMLYSIVYNYGNEIRKFEDSKIQWQKELYYMYRMLKGNKVAIINAIVNYSNRDYEEYDWKKSINENLLEVEKYIPAGKI